MAGYVIACVRWHDSDASNRYREMVIESLRPFGGRYLARGKPAASLEGADSPERLAMLEFPSARAAQQWHESQEYAPALKVRRDHATTHWLVIMDGMS